MVVWPQVNIKIVRSYVVKCPRFNDITWNCSCHRLCNKLINSMLLLWLLQQRPGFFLLSSANRILLVCFHLDYNGSSLACAQAWKLQQNTEDIPWEHACTMPLLGLSFPLLLYFQLLTEVHFKFFGNKKERVSVNLLWQSKPWLDFWR
jgi:hypothetical protein